MTIAQAIKKAMKNFRKDIPKGSIRTIRLLSGSGTGESWSKLTIGIEYAINGDYTQSDKNPYCVTVCAPSNQ